MKNIALFLAYWIVLVALFAFFGYWSVDYLFNSSDKVIGLLLSVGAFASAMQIRKSVKELKA